MFVRQCRVFVSESVAIFFTLQPIGRPSALLPVPTGQEALLSWPREFDTVFCDYYPELMCFGLEDEVVMGRQEVDLHRLQNESGLTQLY